MHDSTDTQCALIRCSICSASHHCALLHLQKTKSRMRCKGRVSHGSYHSDKPRLPLETDSWSFLSHLVLADPTFHTPSPVEILIGGEIYEEILLGKKIRGPPGTPAAVSTSLGWLIIGKVDNKFVRNGDMSPPYSSFHISSSSIEERLDQSIRRFWEIESVPEKPILSPEDQRCEEIFVKHTDDWIQVGCRVQLHGFCDSSEVAFAAVVYFRVVHPDNTVSVHILTGKSRVAPKGEKKRTLPRLELCGATVLAKLFDYIRRSLASQVPERRVQKVTAHVVDSEGEPSFVTRFSSFQKLTNVMAYCLRFIKACRTKSKITGPLTVRTFRLSTDHSAEDPQNGEWRRFLTVERTSKGFLVDYETLKTHFGQMYVFTVYQNTRIPTNLQHPHLRSVLRTKIAGLDGV
ncbi:pao retrotransposon peptidase domain-containing protein [Phthorimaea operculella]|nr:pao retrotransposon peptidase domain-containing protein [Phthorimaea operculella]